jgi:hypothetical protein
MISLQYVVQPIVIKTVRWAGLAGAAMATRINFLRESAEN